MAALPVTLTKGIVLGGPPHSDELEGSVSGDRVRGLPSPEDGLARVLAAISPPAALSYGTPWVRVPVTAPPSFSTVDERSHQDRASAIWASGWTLKEQQRRNRAIEDRQTVGARYEQIASLHPWLTLALERASVPWDQALVLAESLMSPALEWFDLEQAALNGGSLQPWACWARTTTDVNGPKETVLTAYRHVAVAVLHDVGSQRGSQRNGTLPEYPVDRQRRPSRLVWAGALNGVTDTSLTNPERGAQKALARGRLILHDLGAWPWASVAQGRLAEQWWTRLDYVTPLAAWRREADRREVSARVSRAAAAAAAGL